MKNKMSVARKHILDGFVGVNLAITRKPDQILNPGDVVEIFPGEEKIKLVKPKSISTPKKLKVWYEDSNILAVEKPAGLLAMPTRDDAKKTLLEAVRKHLGLVGTDQRVYCLQRLDRDVSGVVVFAKDEPSYERLREQFQENKPRRKYVAIVAGKVKDESGTFRSYIATGKHLKRFSVKSEKQGELAITHYKVTRRLAKETVVEVQLETGRRNQIRVHFSEAGHPVIGETRYSRMVARRDAWDGRRIALHANTLAIIHPITGQKLEFCSPWPQEFKAFVQQRSIESKSEGSQDANTAVENVAKPKRDSVPESTANAAELPEKKGKSNAKRRRR
jgi:23S rRNA pseudouridine1911/1915/1917 synthase